MAATTSTKPPVFYLTVAFIFFAIAQGLAFAAGHGGQSWLGVPYLNWLALLNFIIQWIAFVPAYLMQTEKFYDFTGSITYITLIILSLLSTYLFKGSTSIPNTRKIVVSAMSLIWAIRLGSFLVARIFKDGKDGRFDEIKKNPWRFFNAWTIQGAWVMITVLSVVTVNCSPGNDEITAVDWIGFSIWLIGFLFEAIADRQKIMFNMKKSGLWIDEGLWRYSRHPNYFGEITLWLGLFITGISVYQGSQWVCVLSPMFVAFLLIKVSGIPKLEARADEKWGENPEYQVYKQSVSVLIPMVRKAPLAEEETVHTEFIPTVPNPANE